jgi:elongation factor P
MVLSDQITPGMTLTISGKLYRVESCTKVSVPKGAPFIKTKLKELSSHKLIEKNFKLNQSVDDVALKERLLEFLYLEGEQYLFLDIGSLDQVLVPADVVGSKVNYLKEGTEVKGFFFGEEISSIELPQFLELMVSKVEDKGPSKSQTNDTRGALLETGAKIEVPPFIEVGDIIKVDTKTEEYIQRV